jgi:hypothetical protein
MGIVCIGFIVVLLSLGYLLKENEVTTMALKKKLDQQKQLNSSDKSASKAVLTFVDNKQGEAEKLERYKNVIIKNITCTSSEQCMVVNTKKTELNCFVAVNTIGASLLNKALDKDVNKNVNK